MGFTSLQVCMDSSDWLQGTIHEDAGMDSSSSLSGDILTCSRPLIERRVRPQHDQALKCPRCDSTHTKFCYYNNYSLSQPRYFCKTCRRYWTKGGTLRNIPVGGGCRKNKKVSSRKSNDHQSLPNLNPGSSSSSSSKNPNDLQLSFPDVQFSHLFNLPGNHGGGLSNANYNFMDTKYNLMLENPGPIDFMDNKYEALVGHGEFGLMGGVNHDVNYQGLATNISGGLCSPFGLSSDVNDGPVMDTSHRLMLPYEIQQDQSGVDVKPNPKLLSLDWHDQACSDAGKDTFGYLGGLGSWAGFPNGAYGSSATNPLV